MKVLHIALTDRGGAGEGMLNQHRALLERGVDSKVLVGFKRTNLETVVQTAPNQYMWGKSCALQYLQKAARHFGICLNRYDQYKRKLYLIRSSHWTQFSIPVTPYDITDHPLVQEADVINLHYVADFLDYESFFRKMRKPIVWTMRDENPGLGGFHYTSEKEKFYPYFAAIEDEFAAIKKKAIADYEPLHLVALSNKMRDFFLSNECFAGRPITIIPNAINADNFRPQNRAEARKKLGIGENEAVIAFVCCDIRDERKGFKELIMAVQRMQKESNKPLSVLCVGNNDYVGSLPSNWHFLGRIDSVDKLSSVYSAADVFASPSYQESFGKTVVEALYCGTPVVSTPVGIAPEIISERNGALCPIGDSDGLACALQNVLTRTYDKDVIRQEARSTFQPQVVADKYIELYQKIML